MEGVGCRRQIDNLKDAMNTAAMASNGGVAAKKIASEVDRQYILADESGPAVPPSQHQSTGRPQLLCPCLHVAHLFFSPHGKQWIVIPALQISSRLLLFGVLITLVSCRFAGEWLSASAEA